MEANIEMIAMMELTNVLKCLKCFKTATGNMCHIFKIVMENIEEM